MSDFYRDSVKEEVSEMDTKIQEWKSQFGKVFKVVIGGEDFYFRQLRRKEYIDITARSYSGTVDAEVETVKVAVLNVVDVNRYENEAGLATVLAEHVMSKSGFQQVESEEL